VTDIDTTNIRTMIRILIRDGETPPDAARTVLQAIVRPKFHEAAMVQFYPHLLWVANHVAREDVRVIEHVVTTKLRDAAERGEHASVASIARVELSGKCFALPDGRMVQWMLATPAEHRERARWQRAMAAASVRDAELHEVAADEIEAAGASCLAEIDGNAA